MERQTTERDLNDAISYVSDNNSNNCIKMCEWIFVRGLPRHITQNEFQDHFSKYGDISQISFETNEKSKKNLGYAFLSMKESKSTYSVLIDSHSIKDSKIKCKLVKKSMIDKYLEFEANDSESNRIVLADVEKDLGPDYFKTNFAKYGEIKAVRLKPKSKEGNEKLYGYVKFYNKEAAKYALKKEIKKKSQQYKVKKNVEKSKIKTTTIDTEKHDSLQKNKENLYEEKLDNNIDKAIVSPDIENLSVESQKKDRALIQLKSESTWCSEKKNSEEGQDLVSENTDLIECSKFKEETLSKNHTIYNSLVEKDSSDNDKVGKVSITYEIQAKTGPINSKKSLFDYLEKKGVVIEQYDETELEPFYICNNTELKTIQENYFVDKNGMHKVMYQEKTKTPDQSIKDKKRLKKSKNAVKATKKTQGAISKKKRPTITLKKNTPLNEKSESFNLFNANRISFEQKNQITMLDSLKRLSSNELSNFPQYARMFNSSIDYNNLHNNPSNFALSQNTSGNLNNYGINMVYNTAQNNLCKNSAGNYSVLNKQMVNQGFNACYITNQY